jgi:hypothetical protein
MGVGINYPSDARGQCTTNVLRSRTPHLRILRIANYGFKLRTVHQPSRHSVPTNDIAIKMNNTGSSLPQMLFYTDYYRLATGASASGEPGH